MGGALLDVGVYSPPLPYAYAHLPKVGLVVIDLITSPVVSWRGWETPPPPPAPRLSCHSLLNHRRVKTSLSCGDLLLSSAKTLFTFGGWTGFTSTFLSLSIFFLFL